MKYIILSEKPWNVSLAKELGWKLKGKWIYINNKHDFSLDNLMSINPDWIFIPHWSYIIEPSIFNKFKCVVFHMTDLPFGRGGSPLQNLISIGYKDSIITAISVEKGIDEGPVYLKRHLSLEGTAEEIFIRANKVIEEMIVNIVEKNPMPTPQEGEATYFKRRNPEDSSIKSIKSLEKLFDAIRMLDVQGYPSAFLETETFKFEFTRASKRANNSIIADVRITKK